MTGSSGYIGSRLVAALAAAGLDVTATARDPAKLDRFDWPDAVQRVPLDVSDTASCDEAFAAAGPVDVAYFLVHSIGEGDFADQDLDSARRFAAAAERAGVARLVYLGGFVPAGELSAHLASREAVGAALGGAGVELVWLRAAIVLGAGSTSFEVIRHLADRLDVIPLPRWMDAPVSPIAVSDVLWYLTAAADRSRLPAGAYDISDGERTTYAAMIRAYAASRRLPRLWLRVPGVPVSVAAAVVSWIVPLPRTLTADLIMSLGNDMESHDDRIRSIVPDPPGGLTTVVEAMRLASEPAGGGGVTRAADPEELAPTDPDWAGGGRR